MLRIRLARFGTKNRPTYRIVVSERHKDTKGDYIESVGHYNPRSNPKEIAIKKERAEYWLSQGAQPSATVHNLFVSEGIITGPKVKAFIFKKGEPTETPAEEKPAAVAVPATEKAE